MASAICPGSGHRITRNKNNNHKLIQNRHSQFKHLKNNVYRIRGDVKIQMYATTTVCSRLQKVAI